MTRDEIFEQETALSDKLLGTDTPEASVEPLLRAESALQPISQASVIQKARLACLLVDVGTQVNSEDLVKRGLSIFTDYYEEIAGYLHAGSLEYNIGNAKKSLYDIEALRSKGAFRPESVALLTEAKNHYWKAVKLGPIDPQLLVNLANALDQCARVVEALLWFDRALLMKPTFGMAHLNRGQALLFLNNISDSYTISLLYEAKKSFRTALNSGQLPEYLAAQARQYCDDLTRSLLDLGWTDDKIEDYDAQHKQEYEEHDRYWRFCLSNYLVLSEHALYCQCIGARRDDLSILKPSGAIGGDFVPRLELLLNRIKSEFALARSLFYQSLLRDNDGGWDLQASEGTFTELNEGEDIGLRPEFLRTSFRLCFGILDRIAQGLKELYELAEPNEAIYFESFWRPQDQKKQRNEIRWQRINEQRNMGLVALYSLATDLNRTRGEWGHFKEFRNDLEHGLLVLLTQKGVDLPPETKPLLIPFKTVTTKEFTERTLQMLQFTSSAIFSFAFCVRNEGMRTKSKSAVVVEVDKKKIGKD